MKWLKITGVWAAFLLLTLAAIRLVGNEPETTLPITVTTKSYEESLTLCNQWHKQIGFSTGQIALFDAKGRHYSIPCSTLGGQR